MKFLVFIFIFLPMDMDSGVGWTVGVGGGMGRGGQSGKNWDNCKRTTMKKFLKKGNVCVS